MKLYRFSPVETEKEFYSALKHIHREAHKLCWRAFERYYQNSGNLGFFCHYDSEYEYLKTIQKK